MPSLKDEILLTLKAGIVYFLNPYELFQVGEPYHFRSIYATVNRLHKKGLLRKFRKEKKLNLQLTEKGKQYLEKHFKSVKKPRLIWDHRWRLVIFDIPEVKARLRDFLRKYLLALGFGKVQRSVWISPFDLMIQIESYIKKFKISEYVFQLTVQDFQGLSKSELAKKFWHLQELNNKYMKFIQEYSEKLARLEEVPESSPYNKALLGKMLIVSLKWDYQSILSLDPQLPEELLPANWAGKNARQFVASYQVACQEIQSKQLQ